jgi:hypothetical protein
MLTQLSTLKTRLALLDTDTTCDALLVAAIKSVSARFDLECNRTLARSVDATYEFTADETEICVPCYPIETVTKFELKTSESEGWVEQPNVRYLIRRNCVISLNLAFSLQPLALSQARVVYTGGYVLPGSAPLDPPVPVCHNLPDEIEQAAVEQVAYWFQNRDRLGLLRIWDYHATYRHFADLDLLSSVRAVLAKYARWNA